MPKRKQGQTIQTEGAEDKMDDVTLLAQLYKWLGGIPVDQPRSLIPMAAIFPLPSLT